MSVADIPIDLSKYQFSVDPMKGYCFIPNGTSTIVQTPVCVSNSVAGNNPQSMAILSLVLAASLATLQWSTAYQAKYTKPADQIATQQALNEVFKQLKPQMRAWKVCDPFLWTSELISKLPSIPAETVVMIRKAVNNAACVSPLMMIVSVLLLILLAWLVVKILMKLLA